MVMINSIFDKDGDKAVDKTEYEFDNPTVAAYRNYLFKNVDFDTLDIIKDNVIDIKDIRTMRNPFQELLMTKISENEGNWIWKSYVRITVDWLREHFALEPNKTRLLKIDIPIYIFHGKDDASVPVESVYDLEVRFKTCKKSNLKTYTFDKHNHDLNILDWITTKKYPEGLQKLFEIAGKFSSNEPAIYSTK